MPTQDSAMISGLTAASIIKGPPLTVRLSNTNLLLDNNFVLSHLPATEVTVGKNSSSIPGILDK